MEKKIRYVEYMCSVCGKKTTKLITTGRPMPGNCPRRNGQPHRWVSNRRY